MRVKINLEKLNNYKIKIDNIEKGKTRVKFTMIIDEKISKDMIVKEDESKRKYVASNIYDDDLKEFYEGEDITDAIIIYAIKMLADYIHCELKYTNNY